MLYYMPKSWDFYYMPKRLEINENVGVGNKKEINPIFFTL